MEDTKFNLIKALILILKEKNYWRKEKKILCQLTVIFLVNKVLLFQILLIVPDLINLIIKIIKKKFRKD